MQIEEASADNTLPDLHNSSYHTHSQPHPIIVNYKTGP